MNEERRVSHPTSLARKYNLDGYTPPIEPKEKLDKYGKLKVNRQPPQQLRKK